MTLFVMMCVRTILMKHPQHKIHRKWHFTAAYSEPCSSSKMKLFAIAVN